MEDQVGEGSCEVRDVCVYGVGIRERGGVRWTDKDLQTIQSHLCGGRVLRKCQGIRGSPSPEKRS